MKFDLKTPCKDCPFIKDGMMNRSLREGRLDGIKKDLREDHTFTCHKTLDLKEEKQQHCAGALIYIEKLGRPNQMMRFAERLGLYDHTKLNMEAEIDMS